MMPSLLTQKRRTGGRHRLSLLLLFALAMPVKAAAVTVIKVWGAPEAAVQALRSSPLDALWVTETSPSVEPHLQIAWQQDAYQRALASANRAPVLVLSQQAMAESRLRNQDSALVWGPPLAQQIQLVRRLMPLARHIGILYRDAAQADITALVSTSAGALAGAAVEPIRVDAPLSARVLAEAAERVDVLVASNDSTLFNADSAKLILLTAYRHQRAVIGPTPAFVSAGAVATQAVPKPVLIAAIVSRVAHWQDTGSLGESQVIHRFSPVFNLQVARSLGIFIPADLLREARP